MPHDNPGTVWFSGAENLSKTQTRSPQGRHQMKVGSVKCRCVTCRHLSATVDPCIMHMV